MWFPVLGRHFRSNCFSLVGGIFRITVTGIRRKTEISLKTVYQFSDRPVFLEEALALSGPLNALYRKNYYKISSHLPSQGAHRTGPSSLAV